MRDVNLWMLMFPSLYMLKATCQNFEHARRRPMPHNVPLEWTVSMIANPTRDDAVACGLWRHGYVCDANQYLTQHGEDECEGIKKEFNLDLDQLNFDIDILHNATQCRCRPETICHGFGFSVFVVIVRKFALPANVSRERHNRLSYEKFLKKFANDLLHRIDTSQCRDSILILFAVEDQALLTVLGDTTRWHLSQWPAQFCKSRRASENCRNVSKVSSKTRVIEIEEMSVQLLSEGQLFDALSQMIDAYNWMLGGQRVERFEPDYNHPTPALWRELIIYAVGGTILLIVILAVTLACCLKVFSTSAESAQV